MKLPISASLVAVPTLALMAAACGGNVVIDAPSGQGGQGGGGGTDETALVCAAWCDAHVAAGCPFPHQDRCTAALAQKSGDAHAGTSLKADSEAPRLLRPGFKLQTNALVSIIRTLGSSLMASKSLALSPVASPLFPQCHGNPTW